MRGFPGTESREWYYYWGQVTIHIRFIKVPIRLPRLGTETTKFLDQGVILKKCLMIRRKSILVNNLAMLLT